VRQGRRNGGGQSAVETVLLLVLVAAALAAMMGYLQRGYQGYLYSTASGQGEQFDPRRRFNLRQQLTELKQAVTIDIEAVSPTVEDPRGGELLPSIPGGRVAAGRPVRTTSSATTRWSMTRRGAYEAK